MIPIPQLSLCIAVCSETDLLRDFHENLSQFFQKFPLLFEVQFAVNPDQDECLNLLQKLAEKNPHYHFVLNKKRKSRAQNLQMLFGKSRGNILVATDLDLAAPLSEVFKILEAFFSDEETDVVFGNRFKAKKNLISQKTQQNARKSPEVSKLEKFFMDILKEKVPWSFADPFCPVLGIRRTSFEKIEKDLKSSGWHWTQEVQRVAQIRKLKAKEIPLYVGSPIENHHQLKPPITEAFYLLDFVLFRI